MISIFILLFLIVLYETKLRFYNHLLALFIPWMFVLFFSLWDISNLHKPLEDYTYFVIFLFLFFSYLGYKIAYIIKLSKINDFNKVIFIRTNMYYVLFIIYIIITLLNIVLAGYIPLVNLLRTGDSGYMYFGISGLYGFYNAFSNVLGVISFYLYLITHKKRYLYVTLFIVFVFVLFITRQNIISLLVEIFIVYNFVKKRMNITKIIFYLLLILTMFDIIGNARTDDIKAIAEIKPEYNWLPSIIVWIYTYFYINVVNLNNAINFTNAPYFDGSSFSKLIPNVIKNYFNINYEHEYFLEKINFTVSSAINNLYSDFGIFEVTTFIFIFSLLATLLFRKIIYYNSFIYISMYAVLFFCALFSFFTNFWFYLPIIFQIPIFYISNKLIFKRRYL